MLVVGIEIHPPDILDDEGRNEAEIDEEDDIVERVEKYMEGGRRPQAGSLHGALDGGVWSNWTFEMSRDAYSCKAVLIPSSVSGIFT